MKPIPPSEYQSRVESLRRMLRGFEFELFVATTKDSIFYLTGAVFAQDERPVLLLVWADGRSDIIAPLLERTHIGGQIPWAALSTYPEFPAKVGTGWRIGLEELTGRVQRIAIDPQTPVSVAQAFGGRATSQPLVESLRLIKSDAEIGRIRRAAHFADRLVEKMREAAVHGATVAQVYANAGGVGAEAIEELGARYTPFTTSTMAVPWPAPMNAEPHRLPCMSDVFDSGPHNLTSLASFDGYAAESERVHFITPPSTMVAAAHKAVLEARRLAFGMLRPGQPTSDIDATVLSFLRAEGYGDYLLHRTGHGFGLGGHEGPWIAEGADDVLEANMVISIEPGVYIPNVGGIRDSDTVLITESGYEMLTREPYAPTI